MQGFNRISPEIPDNVFRLIGKNWMLITAAGKAADGTDTVGTMTASWGGMGILWNKPVAFCFIRPQRNTYTLTQQSERFSLSFLEETYRPALRLCGTLSGRDTDKFAAAGLSVAKCADVPYVGEARLVLICRKLYTDMLKPEGFTDPTLLTNYKDGDYHRMYVVEIEAAYLRDGAVI